MAINPISVTPYQMQGDANFSSLANLPQVYQQAADQRNVRDTLATLGQGGQVDPMTLIRSGNQGLAQLGLNLQAKQQEQQRQAQQDARQTQRDAITDKSNAAYLSIAQRGAARADAAGPEQSAGQRAKVAQQYGLEPNSDAFRRFVLTGEMPVKADSGVEQRKAEATRAGLTPDHPAYQGFVLTGKMPREDAQPLTATDKKAILEADEMVQGNQATIDNLKQLKELSKSAFTGPMAAQRGYAASFLGPSSDTGRGGIATTELHNLGTANALSQLKATFGAAPTEGERKILLEIQGSANQPDAVRQKIYDRAAELAQKRLDFNRKRADELRGGQFYKPQGAMSRAPVQQSQGITQEQYNALPPGTPFTAPDGTQRVKP